MPDSFDLQARYVAPSDGAPLDGAPTRPDTRIPSGAGHFGDGAPTAPTRSPAGPGDEFGGGMVGKATRLAGRVRTFEGLRGYSTRVAAIAKHVMFLATIIACVATAHWAFSSNPTWRFGGIIMLYSITVMVVVAALGSVLYADQRRQITEQWRHFVFGIVALPGAALALFMRLTAAALSSPAAQNDTFASIITGNGLPLVYAALVTVPPVVFVKYVFGGLRTVNRAAMTDEEHMSSWMRQDGWQR